MKFIDALKPTVPINDDPFTIEELYGALSNMHNGKQQEVTTYQLKPTRPYRKMQNCPLHF